MSAKGFFGNSTKLEEKLQETSSQTLAAVHFVLYGEYAKPNFVKRNIRKYSQLNFEGDDRECHIAKISASLSLNELKSVAIFFDCDVATALDASEITRKIIGCVENESQKNMAAASERSSKSIKSNNSVVSSARFKVKTEICELKDNVMSKELEILEIETDLTNLRASDNNEKDISLKEKEIKTKKKIIEILQKRISNKEVLLEVHEVEQTRQKASDCVSSASDEDGVDNEDRVANWASNASARTCESETQVQDLAKTMNNFLSRQTVGSNLMPFDGSSCLKWPVFLAQYKVASEICGFSDKENVMRLDQALRGEARQCVELLLCTAHEPSVILNILETKYGQPESLLAEIVKMIRGLRRVINSDTLMELCCMVQNISAVIKGKTFNFVDQRNIISQFISKLPGHIITSWGAHLVSQKIKPREETIGDFAKWAQSMSEISSRTAFMNAEFTEMSSSSTNARVPSCSSQSKSCKACNTTEHTLDRCPVFKVADIKKRWKFAESCHACYCCLGYHRGGCNNRKPCGIGGCGKFHHQLLHKTLTSPNTVHVTACTTEVNCDVMLKIIPVRLRGPSGCLIVKAILDEGSTTTLMDSEIAASLGLKGPTSPLCCKWTGDIYRFDDTSQIIQAEISGVTEGESKYFPLKDVRTVNDLNLPNQKCDIDTLVDKFPFIKQAKMTCDYYKNNYNMKPALLIGQNNAKLIVTRQVIQPNAGTPILSKTILGWTVHGPVTSLSTAANNAEMSFLCCENSDENLHQFVKEYFKLENFRSYDKQADKRKSSDDERATRIAENSIKYQNNRYEVALPWKVENTTFPNTKPMALQRLKCLENRLRNDRQLSIAYCNEIQKLLDKGYALPVQNNELNGRQRVWYLPHFAVQNPNKPGKVRIVFDAAAKVNGYSLNDHLLPGPDWLTSLFTMLCTFRLFKIAFTGDIEEMFNRVEIADDDSYAQCFLWRQMKTQEKPKVYRMKAMLFGTASSPFLAQFVKNYNAKKYLATHEKAALAILNNHYVDDYLHGADNEEEAINIIKDVILLHSKAGFNLRKITSNSDLVNRCLPQEVLSTNVVSRMDRSFQENQRVLGMLWNSVSDTFGFSLDFNKIDKNIASGEKIPTKRQVLKLVMSIFDPLGLLSPITIKAKILIQEIWRSGIGWDDFITATMMGKWRKWLEELTKLKQLEIPRFIPIKSFEIELHVFNDASESAYASALYARMEYCGAVNIILITARARVAPLKTITIPKMELSAALMGARLCKEVVSCLNLTVSKRYFWTDSRTVLQWIKSDKKLQTFVAARIGEILELSEEQEWHWVPSGQNIADICTRDGGIQNFNYDHIWFKGPDFLYLSEYQFSEDSSSTIDLKKSPAITLNIILDELTEPPLSIIKTHYSWTKLLRVTSFVKRFVYNLKCQPSKRMTGSITAEEILLSEQQWWKFVQETSFPEDLKNLKASKSNRNGKLRKLALILDNNEILRVSGRIYNAEKISIEKEPVVLCGKHPYVQLMITHLHGKFGHQGLETVINELRRQFWIPRLRSAVKKVIFNCIRCRKQRSKPAQPKMGILPKERFFYYKKPFTATGIDYFGPFYIKSGRKIEKRYGVLFTCLTMRAIHVEIAHSLSTDSCIMAIRRFLSRRGSVKIIMSDNATNFRGASRELLQAYEEVNEELMQEKLANKQIEWKFIPPLSPHMGGAWERLIGCFKRALSTVMMDKHPTDEVLTTIFAEVEYIINSRPLTHVSGDIADDCSITPNDILIGESAYIRAPGLFDEKDLVLRKQWRISQALVDSFWKRWLREYLPTLIGRRKWTSEELNIREGEIVVINDTNLPRGEWPLGVIERTIAGEDGIVRVADVKTSTGTYRRPATKLYRLNICVDQKINTEGQDVANKSAT